MQGTLNARLSGGWMSRIHQEQWRSALARAAWMTRKVVEDDIRNTMEARYYKFI